VPAQLQKDAHTIQDIEKALCKYPGITAPVAGGLAQDINYTPYLKLLHSNYLQLSTKAKEAIGKCFVLHEKQQKKIIQTLWSWWDECLQEATGQPSPTLQGRKPSLQDIQDALARYAGTDTSFTPVKEPILPEWWTESEPEPNKEEVEIIPDLPAPPFKMVTSLADCAEMLADLQKDGAIAFDIETYYPTPRIGKDGARRPSPGKLVMNRFKSKIRLVQLYRADSELVWIMDLMQLGESFRDSPECEQLRKLFAEKLVVGFNIVRFDLPWLWEHLSIRVEHIADLYIAHRILTNGMSPEDNENNLKYCLAADLQVRLPKDQGGSDWGIAQLSERQICYAAHDVYHLHKLLTYYVQIIHQPHNGLGDCWKLEVALSPIVVDLMNRGTPVNLKRLPEIKADAERRMAEAAVHAKELLKAPDINLNSSVQLLRALHAIGYRMSSTSKKALAYSGMEVARAILAYRNIRDKEVKFLTIVEGAVQRDGRVHSRYDQLGTVSGRFSSQEPNMQQLPRPDKDNLENSVRALFTALDDKWKLVIADFGQMELVIAAMTVPGRMLEALKRGEDLHIKTACHIKRIDIRTLDPESKEYKKLRNFGKSCNFGLLYGQSACGGKLDYPNGGLRGFARNVYGVEMTEEEAIHAREEWFNLYPEFREYHRDCWNLAEAFTEVGKGFVRTPGIRRVQYFWTEDQENRPLLKHEVFSSLANTPVQGGGAEIFKLTTVQIPRELPEAEIVNLVHDELVLMCRAADAEHVKKEVERIMVEATHKIFPGAPMKADVTIADNWSQKK